MNRLKITKFKNPVRKSKKLQKIFKNLKSTKKN